MAVYATPALVNVLVVPEVWALTLNSGDAYALSWTSCTSAYSSMHTNPFLSRAVAVQSAYQHMGWVLSCMLAEESSPTLHCMPSPAVIESPIASIRREEATGGGSA